MREPRLPTRHLDVWLAMVRVSRSPIEVMQHLGLLEEELQEAVNDLFADGWAIQIYNRRYLVPARVGQQAALKANRFKEQARKALSMAVRSGRVRKPSECERCARSTPREELHGHHENYREPLLVLWVCRRCHAEIHAELRGAA